MCSHVRFMVLIDKRLGWLTRQESHVFADRIAWLLIVFHWNKVFRILDTKNLQHLPVELWKVVNLRGTLRQLDGRLILHDPLGHSGRIWITDRDHFDDVVVCLFNLSVPAVWCVRVAGGGVIADDRLEQLKLHPQACMHPRLYSTHGLQGALKQSQRRTNRSLCAHVADLHVRDRAQSPPFVGDLVKKLQQCLARLFVRQRHDVVAHRA